MDDKQYAAHMTRAAIASRIDDTKLIADMQAEVASGTRYDRAIRQWRGYLTDAQQADLLIQSAEKTPTELAKLFKISVPSVSYHLKRHAVVAAKRAKVNRPEAQAFIIKAAQTFSASELASAFDVTPAAIYAIWRGAPDAPGKSRGDKVGNKVTQAHLTTILDLSISAFDAATHTGLSIPTIYNYRRRAKASPAAAAAAAPPVALAVDDLI